MYEVQFFFYFLYLYIYHIYNLHNNLNYLSISIPIPVSISISIPIQHFINHVIFYILTRLVANISNFNIYNLLNKHLLIILQLLPSV